MRSHIKWDMPTKKLNWQVLQQFNEITTQQVCNQSTDISQQEPSVYHCCIFAGSLLLRDKGIAWVSGENEGTMFLLRGVGGEHAKVGGEGI